MIWANNADPDQTTPRLRSALFAILSAFFEGIFLPSAVSTLCSNLRVFTTNISGENEVENVIFLR